LGPTVLRDLTYAVSYSRIILMSFQTTQPATDAEKIKSEVVRQVQMCTCHQPFKVKELGEGKYRVRAQVVMPVNRPAPL